MGDFQGHPFRGNQYVSEGHRVSYRGREATVVGTTMSGFGKRPEFGKRDEHGAVATVWVDGEKQARTASGDELTHIGVAYPSSKPMERDDAKRMLRASTDKTPEERAALEALSRAEYGKDPAAIAKASDRVVELAQARKPRDLEKLKTEAKSRERKSILAGGDRPAPSGATGGILSFWNEKTRSVEYVDARDATPEQKARFEREKAARKGGRVSELEKPYDDADNPRKDGPTFTGGHPDTKDRFVDRDREAFESSPLAMAREGERLMAEGQRTGNMFMVDRGLKLQERAERERLKLKTETAVNVVKKPWGPGSFASKKSGSVRDLLRGPVKDVRGARKSKANWGPR